MKQKINAKQEANMQEEMAGGNFKNLFEYYQFTKRDEKKYPVVSKILKQLTPERMKKEVEKVEKTELPPELRRWVREYEKVGKRDGYIWGWIYNGSQNATLYEVEKKYQRSAWEIKFFVMMLDVLIDDIADKKKDKKLLNELLKIPFNQHYIKFKRLNNEEKKYVKFIIKVWQRIYSIFKKCPKYKETKAFFEYDIKQILNAMDYACLVNNHNHLINETEYRSYLTHNMQFITDVTIDLAYLHNFDVKELGKIREAAWYAQEMLRVENWVSTWEREIAVEDFTSGVFACAVKNRIVTTEDLKEKNKLEIIKKIRRSKVEKELLKEWEQNYQKIKRLNKEIKTVSIEKLLFFLKKITISHFISRGYA